MWLDGDAVIVIDRDLGRRERKVVLAHELTHLERGIGTDYRGAPASWQTVVAREEGIVNRIVAERLVPPDELAEWVGARTASDLPTSPLDVAEQFDVTEDVARRAMVRLKEQG